jgi:hypothetical protein
MISAGWGEATTKKSRGSGASSGAWKRPVLSVRSKVPRGWWM